jgi:urease accessory protein
MLTDGRFPSGGHAYSAGMEQAVAWGDVVDLGTAEAFAVGRAATTSTAAAQVATSAAVAAASGPGGSAGAIGVHLDALDDEVDARMPSSAAREVSRQQGRRWLRTVREVWPEPFDRLSTAPGPGGAGVLAGRHAWVVTGGAVGVLGLRPQDAATVALYELVGTPLWAAVRLLGLDPVATAGVIARLVAGLQPAIATSAARAADRAAAVLADPAEPADWSWISWSTAPMSDLAAEAHRGREERLFAS